MWQRRNMLLSRFQRFFVLQKWDGQVMDLERDEYYKLTSRNKIEFKCMKAPNG